LQQNPHEGFSNTPRVSFEKIIRAGLLQRLAARTATPTCLLKIQLIKFTADSRTDDPAVQLMRRVFVTP
jgi:hypothetical protein